jgi:Protein of unknown function (DUF3631)
MYVVGRVGARSPPASIGSTSFPADVSHVAVVEDDVEACPDFAARVARLIQSKPDDLVDLWISQNHGRAAEELANPEAASGDRLVRVAAAAKRGEQVWARLQPICVPVVALLFPVEVALNFRDWATVHPPELDGIDDNLAVTDFIRATGIDLLAPLADRGLRAALRRAHRRPGDGGRALGSAHVGDAGGARDAVPARDERRAGERQDEAARGPARTGTGTLSTVNISDAALFRVIEAKAPTLLFDEVDSIFNEKARERGLRDDLRALLNAGYRRGERVYRMGGGNKTALESFAVFCAKALAGLGSLPPTLASRCLRIELKRRRLDEPVEDFFPDDLVDEATRLRTRFAARADAETEELRTLRPPRLEGLRDRANEVWRPLLAIADRAGGDWPARARRSSLVLSAPVDEDPSLGLLLLTDLRAIFDELQAERIPTADLIRALATVEESPWGEWWLDAKTDEPLKSGPRRHSQLLRPYGIRPRLVRIGTDTARGYRREDFVACGRFLPPSRVAVNAVTSVTSATREPQSQADVTDVTDVTDIRDAEQEPPA